MDKIELASIRNVLVDRVFRNPVLMFDDKVRGETSYDDLDLLAVIASLYEMLHQEVTGESYRYFFHWANKCGGYVEDDLFDKYVKGVIK